MRIGLIDVDRTGFPNLALMKLSAWHKAQGDDVTLLRGDKWLLTVLMFDRVYASAVFSWNRAKADALAALGAVVGGTGYRKGTKLPPEIAATKPDYALYGIDYGMGFLSRGCIRDCGFCGVPSEEGLPWLDQTIDAMINPARERPFLVLMDNEFFWNIKWAIAQMETFTTRGIDWCPSQGLDIRCTTPALCDTLAASPFWNLHRTRRQITFAFDDANIERRYRQGVEMLLAAGMKAWQMQSFVLVGFDAVTRQPRGLHAADHRRVAVIREYGIDPFVMVYRDNESGQAIADPPLRNFARWVNRRLHKICTFDDLRAEPTKGRMTPEELYESIGGDLCSCQRLDMPSWCEKCQWRIGLIANEMQLAAAPVPCAASPADPRVEVEAEEGCFAVDVWTGDEAFRLNVFDTFEEAESYRRIVAETFGLRATASTEAGRVDKGWFARQAQRTAEDIKQLPDWLRATGEGARDAMDTNHNGKPAPVGDEPVRGDDTAPDHRRVQGKVAVSLDPHRLLVEADSWLAAHEADPRFTHDVFDIEARGLVRSLLARLRGEAAVRVEE